MDEGAELSTRTGESLAAIIEGVEATADKIGTIAAAAVEQSQNAVEVADAIGRVSEVTERVAASSEEMATGSEQLGAQAGQLQSLVSRFKTDRASSSGTECATKPPHKQRLEHAVAAAVANA